MPVNRSVIAAALIASAVCFWGVAPAGAQTAKPPTAKAADTNGPAWASLTPAQRAALAPLEREWGTIDALRKAKWLEIATHYPAMPEGEQQRLQQRMAEWARLTPVERGRARLSFQEAKQLSPQERQARWEAYQALPEEDRQALAARARPKVEPVKPAGSAPMTVVPKQNIAASAPSAGSVVKPVAPTMVQAKPGATTTLMTKTPTPPQHQRPGQPKIEAQPGEVNRATLLPQRGPQGAVARAETAAPSASPARP